MKETIQFHVGQESGFIKENGTWFLENWASNLEEYNLDRRKIRKVKNVLAWLVNSGAVEEISDLSTTWRDDAEYTPYKGKYYRQAYIENAEPVSIEDLDVPGVRYDFGDFIVIAPEGWN